MSIGAGIPATTDTFSLRYDSLLHFTLLEFRRARPVGCIGRDSPEKGSDRERFHREFTHPVSRVPGVVHVTNLIRLPQQVSTQEIRSGIERALVRSAEIDADNVNVETDGGHVTLTGTVRSWVEREEAEAAARRGGVTSVTNDIRIAPL